MQELFLMFINAFHFIIISDLVADKMDEMLRPVIASCCVGYFHPSCLGSYILYLIFLSMSDYLLLGFELELYSLYEYSYIYWFLSEFTYKWLISLLESGESNVCSYFLNEHFYNFKLSVKMEKGQEKKKSRTKNKVLKSHKYEIQLYRCLQKLFEAYYKVFINFNLII
ncbi:unnamed protein product [Soboliphyme baturini]|uniref:Protein MAK10 homolog n=1 Tax=Soboliphyme baturini TaxID=241478 RepID=A0A183J8Y1_9BILA|nr:unnamed protein product [Soboliphyme baturini]